MCFIGLGDDQATARLFVESMDDPGPLLTADPGKSGKMMQQRIHERVLSLTGTRMNNQSSRFVDHDQFVIFVENVERDGFWKIIEFFRRRLVNLNTISGPDEIPRSGRGSIQSHILISNERLNARPREFCELTREKLIETQAAAFLRHDQLNGFCHVETRRRCRSLHYFVVYVDLIEIPRPKTQAPNKSKASNLQFSAQSRARPIWSFLGIRVLEFGVCFESWLWAFGIWCFRLACLLLVKHR
jgi:hypothetical protein